MKPFATLIGRVQVASFALLFAATASAGSGGGGGSDDENSCRHGKLERADDAASVLDKAWDPQSGRDLRNFPPDRVVDLLHMKLQLRFEALDDMRFEAIETLRFAPLGTACAALTLDAVDLNITSVRLGQHPIEFFQDDDIVTLLFDPPLPIGEEHSVTFEYICDHPTTGMIFTPGSEDAPHYTAEVHTQGETEHNRHWFICHDSPNERLTTELIVNVPKTCSVSANGHLVSHLESGDRANWHWLQDKPHVSYLVSLVIGEFDIVEIPHDRVPMKVWVPKGQADRVLPTFGRTGQMIDVLERGFGVPYPWDRYDQVAVKNFGAGGMENTSVTSLYPSSALDDIALADNDLESLISHELAHQWTGDLITCKSWEHIWLNEGWASYGEALWWEHIEGEDGYLDEIRSAFGVADRDKTSNVLGMVSPIYEDAWEVFRRKANPYPKGESILHMLRKMLGDQVFFKGVHLYMNRHQYGVAETSDFRYALEEVSGRGLEWFFQQWCYRPGTPELDVALSYDPIERQLHARIEQKQQIDRRTPAFRFTLPIHATTGNGTRVFNVEVTERTTSFQAALDSAPHIIAVDPHLHVLKTITVDKPQQMWIQQVTAGPTIIARHEAIKAIGKTDTPQTISLLERLIRDSDTRYTLRETAVRSLRKYGSDEAKEALLVLMTEGVEHPRVRNDLAEAGRDLVSEKSVPVLARIAQTDLSYKTRVAAIESLVALKAKDQVEVIASLTHFESQHEDVRTAALRALGEFDAEVGLDLAIQYSAYGTLDRARAAAVGIIGKLAHYDLDRAVPLLIDLLDDPERRSREAAAGALVEAADERGVPALRAVAETARGDGWRETAQERLEALEKKIAEAAEKETP